MNQGSKTRAIDQNSDQARKNILYVSSFGNFVGGGEVSLVGILQNLNQDLFVPNMACGEDGMLKEFAEAYGIKVHHIPMEPVRPLSPLSPLRSIQRLRACMEQSGIDLVHANSSRAALFGGIAAYTRGIPMIWHVRIAGSDPKLDWLLARLAARIVVNSRAVAKRFDHGAGSGKVQVVYNGVDTERFSPAEERDHIRRELGFGPDEVIVLVMGRLTKEKGHPQFIDAAARVRDPRCRFVMVGEEYPESGGPFTRNLQEKVRAYGLWEKVRFAGYQKSPERWFQGADILVVPSLEEGFGRAAAEGGACGLPVIASRVGGLSEVVSDGETGLLVEPNDPDGLALAIDKLAVDTSLSKAMGQAARERVRRTFRMDIHVRRLEAIYKEILSA